MIARYYHSVLADALPAWEALGWREVGRDRKPSVAQDIVLIEWSDSDVAPVPRTEAA
jgi:hypothetical protein